MEIKVNITKQEKKRDKLPKGITTTMGILSVLSFIASYLIPKIADNSEMHFIIKEMENAFTGLSILFFFLFFIFLIVRTEESDL